MDDIKRMDIKEFRDLGLLAELNRTFLHPLGLALEVIVDEDTGDERLGGIWDYRDDPEGIIFRNFPSANIRKARNFIQQKHEQRLKALGFIVQEHDMTERGDT